MWSSTRPGSTEKPVGEVGVLQQVLLNQLMNTTIFIFINFNGVRYMGSMRFDDPNFCAIVCDALKSHIGCSIKEIGDLDLSHTF
jgi:hypothetical protein